MNALLLLLLDSRAPAGAHNHSAGMEAAVGTGLVGDLASLEDFCRARLATSGRVAAALADGTPLLAARAAALAACAGPASAAVRLLGLDPFAVQAMLARLAPRIDACAQAVSSPAPPPSLPCDGAPALDLLADFHLTAEVRLFAS